MKCVQGSKGHSSILSAAVWTAASAPQALISGLQNADTLATSTGEHTRTSTMQKTAEGMVLRSHADWQGGVGPDGARTNFCKVDLQQAVAGSLLEEHKEQARISWAKFRTDENTTVHGIIHDNEGPGQCHQVRVGVSGDLADFLDNEEVYVARSAKSDNPNVIVSDIETVKVTQDVTAFLNVENDAHRQARSLAEGPLVSRPSGAIRQFDKEMPLDTDVQLRIHKPIA